MRLASLEPAVYVPTGQSWGGYTDRIHLLHRRFASSALNVTQLLLSSAVFQGQFIACARNVSWLARGARAAERAGRPIDKHGYLNLEALIMAAFRWYRIPVRLFRLPAVNVVRSSDPSRWSQPHALAELAPYRLWLKGRPDEANWFGALKACRSAPAGFGGLADINATLAALNSSRPSVDHSAVRHGSTAAWIRLSPHATDGGV